MSGEYNEELRDLLQKLVNTTHSIVNEGLGKGTLQPQYARYFKWELREYEYGDTGITKKSASGKDFLKPDWSRATRDICKTVGKLDFYGDILAAILQDYNINKADSEHYLEQLTEKVARDILLGTIKAAHDLAKYIDSFIKDLKGGNTEYRAEVQLYGLILQPRSIQLDDNVRLRKPTRKDFEREVQIMFPAHGTMPLIDPTAFLHTRIYGKPTSALGLGLSRLLQDEINREIAVLRLFRVGAVQYIQYTPDSDSIIRFGFGTLTSGRLSGSDKYLVTEDDVKSLKRFWVIMKNIELPSSAYVGSNKKPDELSIAYDTYCDSLEGKTIEKRVSSAVMGLEALYLGGGEQQEMGYRLRMRMSRLLSLIGFDPNETCERIKDAYDIRSKYVHGGLLNQKDRRKIERKHGDINEFPKIIMDYLRASIVALLNRPSKNSLIQKIDDSFLDSEKEKEIKKLLFIPY